MELTKKTTILFTEHQFKLLKQIAALRKTSIGDLIRRACETEYGLVSGQEAVEAVKRLSSMALPASDIEQMKAEIMHIKPGPV